MQWQLLARILGNIVIVSLVRWHLLPAKYLQLSDGDLMVIGIAAWGAITYGWNRYEAYRKGLTPGSPFLPTNLLGIFHPPKVLNNVVTAPQTISNNPPTPTPKA